MIDICIECSENAGVWVEKRADGVYACLHRHGPVRWRWHCETHSKGGNGFSTLGAVFLDAKRWCGPRDSGDMPCSIETSAYPDREKENQANDPGRLNASETTAPDLFEQCAELKREIAVLRRDRFDLAQSVGELTAENAKLRKEVETLRVRVNGSDSLCENLQEQIKTLECLHDRIVGGELGWACGEHDGEGTLWSSLAKHLRDFRECTVRISADGVRLAHHCPPPLGNPTREEAIAECGRLREELKKFRRTLPYIRGTAHAIMNLTEGFE